MARVHGGARQSRDGLHGLLGEDRLSVLREAVCCLVMESTTFVYWELDEGL